MALSLPASQSVWSAEHALSAFNIVQNISSWFLQVVCVKFCKGGHLGLVYAAWRYWVF